MTVYLAWLGTRHDALHPDTMSRLRPPLLVSYVYADRFLSILAGRNGYRQWALDSGAFTAWTQKKVIDVEAYGDFIERMRLQDDGRLVDIFSLDVIGDWRAGLRNTERLVARGIPVIPTYHAGEPEDVLLGLARDFDKIAIGGLVGKPTAYKRRVCEQVFARVWPKKIHGFGVGGRSLVLAFPWHSVDASNWETSVVRYGRWMLERPITRPSKASYTGQRGSRQNLETEIRYYLRLERLATHQWEPTWNALSGSSRPSPEDSTRPSSSRISSTRAARSRPSRSTTDSVTVGNSKRRVVSRRRSGSPS